MMAEDENNLIGFIEEDVSEFTKFDPDDTIHKELHNEQITKIKLLKRCAFTVTTMVVSSTCVIGSFSILCVYFDLNFANLCNSTKWSELPHLLKVVHIFSKSLYDQLFLLWYVIDLLLVFPMTTVKRQVLVLANLLAGCIDTIYRMSTMITNIYGKSFLGAPQFVMFFFMSVYTPWSCLEGHQTTRMKKLKLVFVLNIQFVIGLLFYAFDLFVILPTFNKANTFTRLTIALIIPVSGYTTRILCRACLQTIKDFVHPGKLYILSAGLHALTISTYRILQANVQSLPDFLLLGFLHGVVGLIEQVSQTYQRNIVAIICTKINRDYRIERKARERRESADVLIMSILYELWGVLITNFMFTLYAVQHSVPMKERGINIIQLMVYKILYSMLIEASFCFLSIQFIIRKINLPIISVWRYRWKRFLLTLTINAVFSLFLASKMLSVVTESTYYEHLVEQGSKHLAEQLKMCNYTSKPF